MFVSFKKKSSCDFCVRRVDVQSRILFLSLFFFYCLLLLSLSACGRGWKDSLALTGLREKPDESRIRVYESLVLPEDDRIIAPNKLASRAAVRPVNNQPVNNQSTNNYMVNKALFGEEVAKKEHERIKNTRKNEVYSPTEERLLRAVEPFNSANYGDSPVPASESGGKKNSKWELPMVSRN